MADLSPFHPDYGAPGEAVPPPQAQAAPAPAPDLTQRWKDFLSDDASRAALVSFGAQLAQPMAVGQNWMGHIGQALGKGGEGATKATAIAMKEDENASKQDLRAAMADAATSRSQTAAAQADTAATRAAAYQTQVESNAALNESRAALQSATIAKLEKEAELLGTKIRLAPDNAAYKQMLDETNAELNRAKAIHIQNRGGQPQRPQAGAGTPPADGANPQTAGASPDPAAPPPLAPTDPKWRKPNTVYSNSQGQKALWTGFGWVPQ